MPASITLESKEGSWRFRYRDRRFFSIGINHVEPHLLLAPYNREATLRRYGSDFVDGRGAFDPGSAAAASWRSTVLNDFKRWGFNTFGYHTSVPYGWLRGTDLAYIAAVRSYVLERFCPEAERPDVFSEAFRQRVDAAARAVCEENRDAPNLLGYAFADVPDWELELKRYPDGLPSVHPWVAEIAALPPEAAGKQRWIDGLRARYREARAVASIYGAVPTADWQGLAALCDWANPNDPDAARADSERFLQEIARAWCRSHCDAVRKRDPDHLILGDKIKLGAYQLPFVADLASEYFDLLLVQCPPRWLETRSALHALHERSGKPLLLGDSAFSVKSDQHTQGVKGVRCSSDEEAGTAYANYLKAIAAEPYVVGWHICGYLEGWPGSSIPERALSHLQCGLKDPFDDERSAYVRTVASANEAASTDLGEGSI